MCQVEFGGVWLDDAIKLLVICAVIGAILGFFMGSAFAWYFDALSTREGVFGGIGLGGLIGFIIGFALLRGR